MRINLPKFTTLLSFNDDVIKFLCNFHENSYRPAVVVYTYFTNLNFFEKNFWCKFLKFQVEKHHQPSLPLSFKWLMAASCCENLFFPSECFSFSLFTHLPTYIHTFYDDYDNIAFSCDISYKMYTDCVMNTHDLIKSYDIVHMCSCMFIGSTE